MNWETRSKNTSVIEGDECCPHLAVGDTAYVREGEQDSFGPVTGFCYCEPCWEAYLPVNRPVKVTTVDLDTDAKIVAFMRKTLAKTIVDMSSESLNSAETFGLIDSATKIEIDINEDKTSMMLSLPAGVFVKLEFELDEYQMEILLRYHEGIIKVLDEVKATGESREILQRWSY